MLLVITALENIGDNKSGEQTLLIYSTQQPLSDVLVKLGKLVKDNVYV